jgi:hypothetical protein
MLPPPDLTNVPDGQMTGAGMAVTLADGKTRTTVRCGDKVTLDTPAKNTGTVHCWTADGFMVTLDTPVTVNNYLPPVAAFACQGGHVHSIDQRRDR